MAIHKRDRSFSKILDEIDIDAIPFNFIREIRVELADGSFVAFERSRLDEFTSVEDILMNSNIGQDITDMIIQLDYDLIEENVTAQVDKLLKNDK